MLKRTHGGALPLHQVVWERPEKQTVRDIESVKENYFAPEHIKVRVVTNSIVIAEVLRKKDNVNVILLGGEMDGKRNCHDAFAVEMVKRLRLDKCFITSTFVSVGFGLSL